MLLDIFFPPHCGNCKKKGSYLCTSCKSQLLPYLEVCCLCNKYSKNYSICPNCKKEFSYKLEHIIIGFYYNSTIKHLILSIKYRHMYHIADFLAQRLDRLLNIYLNYLDRNQTLIIGIPSHWWRKYIIKGYNQSELLAQKLAKMSKIHYVPLVKKIHATHSQVGLNKIQRQNNLKKSFIISNKYKKQLANIQHIIIVDDIVTTGSSIKEVAKIIKKDFPHMKIHGLVLAKR